MLITKVPTFFIPVWFELVIKQVCVWCPMFGPTHYILQTRPLLDFRQTNREKRQQTTEREKKRETPS